MKVEMAILQKKDRSTRALKPFMVDERWADRIQKQTKGKIYKVPEEERQLNRPARKTSPRKRSRRNAEE